MSRVSGYHTSIAILYYSYIKCHTMSALTCWSLWSLGTIRSGRCCGTELVEVHIIPVQVLSGRTGNTDAIEVLHKLST